MIDRALDDTHDPTLQSWVESANQPDTDFPIQNLPFGRFRRAAHEPWRIGVAIGSRVLDLQAAGLIEHQDINALMAAGPGHRRALRRRLSQGLRLGSPHRANFAEALWTQDEVQLGLPCEVRDYTDFYTGIHHARTVGQLLRPDQPLLPNYRWLPIGYHGRASSIVASGQGFHRPYGQVMAAGATAPVLAPSTRLDYEVELGYIVGSGNALGQPVALEAAESHLFGITLLNDWSARDLQAWEYQPLGPFLAKNFATTLSPWMVTLEALLPFRCGFERAADEPQPLPYLDGPTLRAQGMFHITLEAWLHTAAMRAAGQPAQRLTQARQRDAYWAPAQLLAHHSSNGCNLNPGDLLGSGTISGPLAGQGGSLMELSQGGRQPLTLANGEIRTFLEDGDSVILRGHCQREGFRRIGFGDCGGTVLPAHALLQETC